MTNISSFVSIGSVVFLQSFLLAQGATIDNLVSRANIFYVNPAWKSGRSEMRLNDFDQSQFGGPKKAIKLIIHGYIANPDHISIVPVKNAYMSMGYNNIFVADWRDAACLDYMTSRGLIKRVGAKLAKTLNLFMKTSDIPASDVHIIGHSLGAHMAGEIGRHFNGTIGRITGLDPALPLFSESSLDRLQADRAVFVDVIHTGAPVWGDINPAGHVDFYPSYGTTPQPGCNAVDVLTLGCSHYRAPLLFAESICVGNNFPSIKCSLQNIKTNTVENCMQRAKSSEVLMMGQNVLKSGRGYYYLETNKYSPYGNGYNSRFYKTLDRSN